MRVIIKKKDFSVIEHDKHYCEAAERTDYLNGYADALCDIKNGDAKTPVSIERTRNKIIKSMHEYRDKRGWGKTKAKRSEG